MKKPETGEGAARYGITYGGTQGNERRTGDREEQKERKDFESKNEKLEKMQVTKQKSFQWVIFKKN